MFMEKTKKQRLFLFFWNGSEKGTKTSHRKSKLSCIFRKTSIGSGCFCITFSFWFGKKIHVDFPGECWDELPDTQCLEGLRRSLWVDQEEEWCRNPVIYMALGVFPKIGVPQNGWFIMEKPIKMDDLEVPIIFGNIHMLEYIISWKQMSPNRVQIHPGYCFSSIRMLRCWRWKKKMGH